MNIQVDERSQKMISEYEASLSLGCIPNVDVVNHSELTISMLKFCFKQAIANFEYKKIRLFWSSRSVTDSISYQIPINIMLKIVYFNLNIDHMTFSFYNEKISTCFDTFKAVVYCGIIQKKESQLRLEKYNKLFEEKISLLGFEGVPFEENSEAQFQELEALTSTEEQEQKKIAATVEILVALYEMFKNSLGESKASLLKSSYVNEALVANSKNF